MLGMAMNSAKLFFAGKLFKDNKTVVRQLMMGAGAGVIAGIVIGLFAPIWVAAIAAVRPRSSTPRCAKCWKANECSWSRIPSCVRRRCGY